MSLAEPKKLSGTVGQIEWAEGIRSRVEKEFDRVANALQGASEKQHGQDQLDTFAIIGILEEKRAKVLGIEEAGYFIRVWQDLRDQVRQLIREDARYRALRTRQRLTNESAWNASHAL
jgi:hypothetical protein